VLIADKGLLPQSLKDRDFFSLSCLYKLAFEKGSAIYTNLSIKDFFDLSMLKGGLLDDSLVEFVWDRTLVAPFIEREDFLKEALRLEIVNASEIPGLAVLEAGKLNASGIRVSYTLGVSDFKDAVVPKEAEENILFLASKNLANMRSVKYLKARYGAQLEYCDSCKSPAVLVLFNE
jgi:hypothetical protein